MLLTIEAVNVGLLGRLNVRYARVRDGLFDIRFGHSFKACWSFSGTMNSGWPAALFSGGVSGIARVDPFGALETGAFMVVEACVVF
jgi:hypothetical protein